jgi:hypothetical protein
MPAIKLAVIGYGERLPRTLGSYPSEFKVTATLGHNPEPERCEYSDDVRA